jgi:hypothetical protein
MYGNGVTHKELNDALGKQTGIIIATVRRTEDSLKSNISEVKADVNKDITAVSARVTYVERRGRGENVVASVLSVLVAVVASRFGGS